MASVSASIDPIEINRFDLPLDRWWDRSSASGWLHKYNSVRVPYIRDQACHRFSRSATRANALDGLRVLDVGCGGGVLCEPVAALGATVVGIDPALGTIEAARLHAQATGAKIEYRCTSSEALADAGEQFDVVLAMEVIEHVADADVFVARCAELVAPGGLMILSTLNRTLKSYAYAIVMAERVLHLLPPGTHQWKRFLMPGEIGLMLAKSGLRLADVSGVTMNMFSGGLQLSRDSKVNFILTAQRPAQT